MTKMKLKSNQVKLFNKLIPFIKKKQEDRKFLVEGEGGSGKTFTISYILDKLIAKDFLEKYNVFMVAPTNAAKKVMRKTILELLKNNQETYSKFNKGLLEDKNIEFKTIHSFFKSKQQFDESGNQFFEIQWEKSVMTEMMKEQLKRNSEDPSFKPRKKNIVIVDECSMMDEDMFEMFMKVLENYPSSKMIFMGDRNQLSYVRTGEEKDEEYLSPVFTQIEQQYLLKGNERSNDKGITKIINRSKQSVIKGKYKFKIKKSDLSKNVNLITEKELFNDKKVTDFIKNENPKLITYSNARRDKLNKFVRDRIYTHNHNYIDRFLFLENEQVIFESNYSIGGMIKYYNTDEFVVKDVKYNIIEPISFFNIFKKTFMFQKITLDDGDTLLQICKSQVEVFKYIITIMKRCVKDYFSFDEVNQKYTKGFCDCKLCGNKKFKSIKFYKDEQVCADCYINIRKYIKKRFVCQFCHKLNTHEDCGKARRMNPHKVKKYICGEMYRDIQELHDTYNLPMKYSYAITVYKSQGSTYKNVMIDYKNIYECNRNNTENLTRSMYVAKSRVQDKLWFLNYFHH